MHWRTPTLSFCNISSFLLQRHTTSAAIPELSFLAWIPCPDPPSKTSCSALSAHCHCPRCFSFFIFFGAKRAAVASSRPSSCRPDASAAACTLTHTHPKNKHSVIERVTHTLSQRLRGPVRCRVYDSLCQFALRPSRELLPVVAGRLGAARPGVLRSHSLRHRNRRARIGSGSAGLGRPSLELGDPVTPTSLRSQLALQLFFFAKIKAIFQFCTYFFYNCDLQVFPRFSSNFVLWDLRPHLPL